VKVVVVDVVAARLTVAMVPALLTMVVPLGRIPAAVILSPPASVLPPRPLMLVIVLLVLVAVPVNVKVVAAGEPSILVMDALQLLCMEPVVSRMTSMFSGFGTLVLSRALEVELALIVNFGRNKLRKPLETVADSETVTALHVVAPPGGGLFPVGLHLLFVPFVVLVSAGQVPDE
jgi:hypothetical protein